MTDFLSPSQSAPLPPLFAHPTQLLAWQGVSATIPSDWFLRTFGGTSGKGTFRVVDDEGTRLEVVWETPPRAADVQKSIDNFLGGLEREAKKQGQAFRVADHPKLLERKRHERAQLINFGWIGEKGHPDASQGWGAAWQCSGCGRVVVCHIIGRGAESTTKTQRLAAEILQSVECHGVGGWQTWSVFGLRVQVPEEFELETARLLAGRIELRWTRAAKLTPFAMMTPTYLRAPERIGLVRVAAADVVLENEDLADWTVRTVSGADKKRRFALPVAERIGAHEGWLLRGRPRDPRRYIAGLLGHKILKKPPATAEMRVWQEPQINKIFLLDSELRQANIHVVGDLLDSLESH